MRILMMLALVLVGCGATGASTDASDVTGGGGTAGQGEAARGGTGGGAGRGGGNGGNAGGVGGGVSCGDHVCLPGEICVSFAHYGGFPIDGGFTMSPLTPTCTVVPTACGSQPPSCAACLISALGCSIPGVCQDVGPRTFTCILGGG